MSKLTLKSFVGALLIALALPLSADDTPAAINPHDLKILKKFIEDQSITFVQTVPKSMSLSGYVDTSYTKQISGYAHTGNGSSALPSTTSGNVNTTLKLTLDKALPDKNEWGVGFRVDTIYTNSSDLKR